MLAEVLNLIACAVCLILAALSSRSVGRHLRAQKERGLTPSLDVRIINRFSHLWLLVWATWGLVWLAFILGEDSGSNSGPGPSALSTIGTLLVGDLNSLLILACGLSLVFGPVFDNRRVLFTVAGGLGAIAILKYGPLFVEGRSRDGSTSGIWSSALSISALSVLGVGFAVRFKTWVLVLPVLLYGFLQTFYYTSLVSTTVSSAPSRSMWLFLVVVKIWLGGAALVKTGSFRTSPSEAPLLPNWRRYAASFSVVGTILTFCGLMMAGVSAAATAVLLATGLWTTAVLSGARHDREFPQVESALAPRDEEIERLYASLHLLDTGTEEYIRTLKALRTLQEEEANEMRARFAPERAEAQAARAAMADARTLLDKHGTSPEC